MSYNKILNIRRVSPDEQHAKVKSILKLRDRKGCLLSASRLGDKPDNRTLIQHPVSSIQHPVSGIQYPASAFLFWFRSNQ